MHRNGEYKIQILLKVAATIVLTCLYTKVIYVWTWLDAFFESKLAEHMYVGLAALFNVNGSEQGDSMVLIVFLMLSLTASLLTIWLVSRFMLGPLYRRTRRLMVSAPTLND